MWLCFLNTFIEAFWQGYLFPEDISQHNHNVIKTQLLMRYICYLESRMEAYFNVLYVVNNDEKEIGVDNVNHIIF